MPYMKFESSEAVCDRVKCFEFTIHIVYPTAATKTNSRDKHDYITAATILQHLEITQIHQTVMINVLCWMNSICSESGVITELNYLRYAYIENILAILKYRLG